MRLRTQLLLAMLCVSTVLTSASLLLIRRSVRSNVRSQTQQGIAASVRAFERIERQQQEELSRTAALLAELPTLKALMTTEHAATIQDASTVFWNLANSDAMVLATTDARVMAVHATAPGLTTAVAAAKVNGSIAGHESSAWWLDGDQLYRFVVQPIIAGSGDQRQALGYLFVGRRVSATFAQELGHFTASDITLTSGESPVASTLSGPARDRFYALLRSGEVREINTPREIRLASHPYEIASVDLDAGSGAAIRCYVLLPLDASYAYLDRLNRTILGLGLAVLIAGAILVMIIAAAITRPVEDLVGAVRALARGDYDYALRARGSSEVAELATSFDKMRRQILESQRKQLESERLAALGRAAGCISHDLRHHLAALVANAEFLREADSLGFDRAEIYREVERASADMTELIDSLVEIARERKAVIPSEGNLQEVVRRAVEGIRNNPDFRHRELTIEVAGEVCGTFDSRKLERALFNLLLNACEATQRNSGRVGVVLSATDNWLEIRVWDGGPGIPEPIRETLFEPFVSYGKNNGTGLGLAIASKIAVDHDGEIRVESTSSTGTTMLLRIPRHAVAVTQAGAANLSV
jgi:signal transduction histidine kinase